MTDIVLAVPIGATSFQRAQEVVSEEVAARVRVKALKDRRNEENAIHDRFGEWYSHGSDELIRLAKAFLIYCREQYGNEEVGV